MHHENGAPGRRYGGKAAEVRRANRRQQLLEAGFDLLAEGGAPAVTVTGVCSRAGLTARYFYEHFADRDALIDAIFDAEAQAVSDRILRAALQAPGDPPAKAVAAVLGLLEAYESDPRRIQLGLGSGRQDALHRRRLAINRSFGALMQENFRVVWPGADAQPGVLAVAASLAVGGVLEIVHEWLDGALGVDRVEVAELCSRYTLAVGEALLRPVATSAAGDSRG